MNNRRTLGFLLVTFVALGILLIFQGSGGDQDDAPPAPTGVFDARLFPELTVLEIVAIQLFDPARERSFTIARREGGLWEAVGVEGQLEPDAGTLIARTIVLLSYTNTFDPPADGNMQQFGLQPTASLFVQILLNNGQEHIVAIGNPLQDAPEFYALVNDRPEIYTVFRQPFDYLATVLTNPPVIDQ